MYINRQQYSEQSLVSEFNYLREFEQWDNAQDVLSTLRTLYPTSPVVVKLISEFTEQLRKGHFEKLAG